jgi:flagellin-like hook-associated protein FlgL
MASNITLSAGVRSNLLNLQSTAALKDLTQGRLSTGKKVNSALDNPSNFFTAASLSSRSSDLLNLLDGISSGIQTLKAADNGIKSITSSIESLQATVRQARQDKSFKNASFELDGTAIGTSSAKNLAISGGSVGTTPVNIALNSIGGAADQARAISTVAYSAPTAAAAATQASLAASGNFVALGAGETSTFDVNGQTISLDDVTGATIGAAQTEIQSQLDAAFAPGDFTVSNDGTKLTIAGKADGTNSVAITNVTNSGTGDPGFVNAQSSTGTAAVAADDHTFTINGTAITLTSANAATGSAAATEINTQLAAASVTNVTATWNTSTNRLEIAGAADGSNNVTIAGTDAAAVFGTGLTDTGTAAGASSVKSVDQLVDAINSNTSLSGKVRASNDSGKLRIENLSTLELNIDGFNATSQKFDGSGTGKTVGGNEVRQNLVTQFNDVRDQLNKLADDSSFNGINLLRGDKLKLNFNETSTSSITIQSKNANGINTTTLEITAATTDEFGSDTSLDARLEQLSDALTTLRSESSAFGSKLSIVQNRQDFTKALTNTLQVGADNLTLADTNEEGANLLALNTRQQLQTTSLSFASQADQAVLQFLR